MVDYQFWTLVGMMIIGFGWTISKLAALNLRLTVMETTLSMIAMYMMEKK